jgi:hypothetical protein
MTRKFDRVPSLDPRNAQHPVSLLWTKEYSQCTMTQAPEIVTKKWDDYAFLDQGNEGACVGFGTSGELAALPEAVPNVDNNFAFGLYNEAKTVDEWPGEDYEGTSVLAGAKVAKSRGYYSSYLWADNELDMARTVSNFGPVIIGINWYQGMMDPDSQGFLHPTGEVVGGHCVVVIGIDVEKGFYTIRNSWGKSWGIGGEAKISRTDMAKLIAENGDVCKPVRVSLNPIPPQPTPNHRKCSWFEKVYMFFITGKWGCYDE